MLWTFNYFYLESVKNVTDFVVVTQFLSSAVCLLHIIYFPYLSSNFDKKVYRIIFIYWKLDVHHFVKNIIMIIDLSENLSAISISNADRRMVIALFLLFLEKTTDFWI